MCSDILHPSVLINGYTARVILSYTAIPVVHHIKLYTDVPPGITMVPEHRQILKSKILNPQIAPNGGSIGV